jgi:hypothetical protein
MFDGIVASERANHERRLFFAVPGCQVRLEVEPLSTRLAHGTCDGLRKVLPHQAAWRCWVGGGAGAWIYDSIVLVEGGVCNSPFAGFDAGYTVPEHVATGDEVRWHVRGTFTAEVQYRTWPRQIQAWGVVRSDRTAWICFICPVAVRVKVLCPVQCSPQSFNGLALGPVAYITEILTVRVETRRVGNNLILPVEQALRAVHSLSEASAKMGHAVQELTSSLFAATRVTTVQEVGVIAMRGRIRYLVAIRSAYATERLAAARELVHGLRLEAVAI